jgi:DnaJ-domain-containing protein 1
VPLVPSEFLHGRARARVRAGKSERASQLTPQKRRALSILGLDSAADADTVRRRFRTLAAELHPDRFPFASGVERAANMRRFAELSAAYHAIV